ncbi:MAG: anhydro-N-acetylmuramic acid kinase [Luteibaculum sp.]
MQKWKALGIMSGSSLDGLDLALSEYTLNQEKWSFKILHRDSIELPDNLKELLKTSTSLSGEDLVLLDITYGKWIASQLGDFLADYPKPDVVGLHGHTVFHKPDLGYSLQIGSADHVAASVSCPVVSNFRQKNIALGGQGAPLVPIGDFHLFNDFDACVNLGGICNTTLLNRQDLLAWDISACNQVFNFLAHEMGQAFDKDGVIALSGSLDEDLLQALNRLSYYDLKAPKSIGNHWVKENFIPLVQRAKSSVPDKMHTVQRHLVDRICTELKSYGVKKALLTGGGAHNANFVQRLRDQGDIEFIVPEKQIVDFKEAIIFGFLALLRILCKENILSSYTNSKFNLSGGSIS